MTYCGCFNGKSTSNRFIVKIRLRREGMVLRAEKWVESVVAPTLLIIFRVGIMAKPLFINIEAQKILS